jgi:hypothetical protein
MSGTSNLGGFKSGCTSNLVVANGVLNAPDYTRTCSCSYQNQTSLALIHMPDVEMWSYSQFGFDSQHGERILRAGINFGAPGNRRAADGTLWLEHPYVGEGNAPRLGVEGLAETASFFRRHSSQVDAGGEGYEWVGASGLVGAGEIVITPSLRRPLLVKPIKVKEGEPKPEPPVQEPLKKVSYPPLAHTVRLHFSEPEAVAVGERVFDVAIQGETVLENFDIAKETGGKGGTVVREIKGVMVSSDLIVRLTPSKGTKAQPVLNGIEFAADAPASAVRGR